MGAFTEQKQNKDCAGIFFPQWNKKTGEGGDDAQKEAVGLSLGQEHCQLNCTSANQVMQVYVEELNKKSFHHKPPKTAFSSTNTERKG